MRCWHERDGDSLEWVKEATGAEERRRLDVERAILARARHPGVVELIERADEPTSRLRTRWVDGVTLATCRSLDGPEVLGLGAALASTVADLHDLGIDHGAIAPEHVLVDPRGRPVLCGFGHASRRSIADRGRQDGRGDTVALCQMVRERLPEPPTRRLRRVLQVGGVGRSVSARQLARHLANPTLGARLPTPDRPSGSTVGSRPLGGVPQSPGSPVGDVDTPVVGAGHDRAPVAVDAGPTVAERSAARFRLLPAGHGWHRRRIAVVALLGATVVGAAVVVLGGVGSGGRSGGGEARGRAGGTVGSRSVAQPAPAPFVAGCPRVDAGCVPVPHATDAMVVDGVGYTLGRARDVIVLGRWACGPASEPALLRPSTGQLWIFERWATAGRDVVGRPLAPVPGATSLRVEPARSSSPRQGGCDQLGVLDQSGRVITHLDPSQAS